MAHDNTVVFVDDHEFFCTILQKGFFKNHQLKEYADLYCYSEPDKFVLDVYNRIINPNYLVIDLHMPGVGGLEVANIVRYACPNCKIWLNTGMPHKYIQQEYIHKFDRYFNKDDGVKLVIDELLTDINHYKELCLSH